LKEMVDDLAEVPPETAIYDGRLEGVDLRRVRSALAYLIQASLSVGPSYDLEAACAEAFSLIRGRGKNGAVLVDNVHGFMDGHRTMVKPETVLVRLRSLARELNVPVIALHPLPPDESHPHTLTRQELNNMERLAKCVNSTLLLSKEDDGLRFLRPKIAVTG